MDPSSLKSRASNRRTSASSVIGWKCDYCRKTFVHEKSFMKHICNGKRRLEQIQSPIGQAAYANYSTWMKLQRHTVPPIDTFMTSKQYSSFIKFTEYCKLLNIDAENFITLIVKNASDITPILWCRNNVYSLYLQFYDQTHDPYLQVADSIEYLAKHAEREGCQLNEVLFVLGFQVVLEAFRLKKLSPWFLFTSSIGIKFLQSLEIDEYKLIESVINAAVWGERFSQNPELVEELQHLSSSAGL
jgi:hypothetical protein